MSPRPSPFNVRQLSEEEEEIFTDPEQFVYPDPNQGIDRLAVDYARNNPADAHTQALQQQRWTGEAQSTPASRAAQLREASTGWHEVRPRVRTGAPGQAPAPFESLAALAPGANSEERSAGGDGSFPGNAPDVGGARGAVQQLAMGGAGPAAGIHPALASLRDEGLARAQKSVNDRMLLAQIARAGGAMIGRAASPLYDSLERGADQPVTDYQQRQAAEQQLAKLGRERAMRDPTSAESRRTQALLRVLPGLEGMVADVPASDADLALKVSEARAKALAPHGKSPEDLELARQGLELRRQLGYGQLAESQARRAENEAFRQQLMGLREEQMARPLREREVPGYEFRSGTIPSATSAEQMRKGLERIGSIRQSLGTMRDVYQRQGAEFGFGAGLNRSQAARQEVLLNLKELENLGVLQKVDVDSLSQLIPDPNSFAGALDKAGMRARFDEFDRVLRDTISERARARNYVPVGGVSAPPGGVPAGKVRVTNGQETAIIDAADEAEAAADGFRRVP